MSNKKKNNNNSETISVELNQKPSSIGLVFKLAILSLLILGGYFLWEGGNYQNNSGELVVEDYTNDYNYYENVFTKKDKEGKPIFNSKPKDNGKNLYILDFDGDVFASQVESLRKEIDAVLSFKEKPDKVLIRINSPGGVVPGYGLVASQIKRLSKNDITTIASIDQVAASGGYMAAVAADEIIAADFAIVGSIGVVANIPIMEEFLGKIGIDYKTYSAGEKKRTVTQFEKPTEKQEEQLNQKLESIHQQFINHVKTNRENLNVEKATNGDYYSGQKALDLGLIDEIKTSDAYIRNHYTQGYEIYKLDYQLPEKSQEGVVQALVSSFVKAVKEQVMEESLSPKI